MAGSAAYAWDVSFSCDETVEFSFDWTERTPDPLADDPFPWADYSYAYVIAGPCGPVSGSVTVDTEQGTATFSAAALPPGDYDHHCRITHLATGKTIDPFDGVLTITR